MYMHVSTGCSIHVYKKSYNKQVCYHMWHKHLQPTCHAMRSRFKVSKRVLQPRRAAASAASHPAWPPPTTTTSYSSSPLTWGDDDDGAELCTVALLAAVELMARVHLLAAVHCCCKVVGTCKRDICACFDQQYHHGCLRKAHLGKRSTNKSI